MLRIIRARELVALRADAGQVPALRQAADAARQEAADARGAAQLARAEALLAAAEAAQARAERTEIQEDTLAGFARLRDSLADPDRAPGIRAEIALHVVRAMIEDARKEAGGEASPRLALLDAILGDPAGRQAAEAGR